MLAPVYTKVPVTTVALPHTPLGVTVVIAATGALAMAEKSWVSLPEIGPTFTLTPVAQIRV